MYQFGMLATGLGYVRDQEITEAVSQQQREDREGRARRSIGAICADMGYLLPWEVDQILTCQAIARDWDTVVCGYATPPANPPDLNPEHP
jgi:hypothetical protein